MNAYQSALQWHSLGIATIPICAGSKRPAVSSWREYQDVLPALHDIEVWFKDTEYNIAVITGHQGLVIVDFDSSWQYSKWLCQLDGNFMLTTQTYHVRTYRGYHYYFWCRDSVSEWHGDGVDIKSRGYCLCPPSSHPSGTPYVGMGSIHRIQHIDNIRDVLPMYEPHSPQQYLGSRRRRDIYDEAMRPRIESGTLEIAKQKVKYEDLLPSLGKGRSIRYALCPIHHEVKPSLAIYEDHWHCFGCHSHGRDALDLFAAINHMSISEAIKELV